ncbi:PucR family transcriptional regulator [Alteribacillus iranensis]|uniref:PucR family transcriptional regulator n=1 Tax=Alteribacillus iranensis TaxID=930128 RepID=UPI001FE1548A|nr:PucR family transcriptional regulator [Alteribacillus iranensis]
MNLQRITVGDFLKRPFFKKAEVIASPSALQRDVTWVHIMDSTNVEHLLNGGELILSTGLGWKEDDEICLSFLRQLIDSQCAGLCVELVTYTKQLPEAAIQLAKDNDFPLVLFYEEVRYIDITQDHYAIFLNYHHKMVTELERLSALLNDSLLSGKDHISLLKEFYQFTGLSLLFEPKQGEPLRFPAKISDAKKQTMATETRSIKVMNHTIAHLTVYSEKEFDEFQRLATDRVEIALAQELMRSMYVEERKSRKEEMWLQRWLTGDYKEDDIRLQLQSMYPDDTFSSLIVCLGHRNNDTTTMIGNTMITRSLFEDRDFTLITTPYQQQTVYLLLIRKDVPTPQLYDSIREVFEILKEDRILDTYAIGQPQNQLNKLRFSYQSAQMVLAIHRRFGSSISPFYDDLHIHRIVYHMDNNHYLESYVQEYLQGLIQYDERKNSQLLRTLKVYLRSNGNKQETAKELFIVRQTLYHRLRKIEDILGSDFFDYHKRLALDIALLGYEYLYSPLSD